MIEPHYADESVTLLHGDCLDVLRALPDNSVDAVVTDPPYGLGFMGREWDDLPPGLPFAQECLRVLKPGGHLVAFGGSRTWHRLAVAVEDAGFEIRDSIAWLYGSGFPKSLDVSKAIDRQRHDTDDKVRVTSWLADNAERNGITRADVDAHMGTSDMGGWWLSRLRHRCAIPTLDQVPRLLEVLKVAAEDVPDDIRGLLIDLNGMKGQPGPAWFARPITQAEVRPLISGDTISFDQRSSTERERRDIPATEAAQQWQGWGTALKPAFEPIVVGRKPFPGTVAANVLEHGTGALNIDGCRVGDEEVENGRAGRGVHAMGSLGGGQMGTTARATAQGRWPTNVVLDESQAAELDKQTAGTRAAKGSTGSTRGGASGSVYGGGAGFGRKQAGEPLDGYEEGGGASRFFPVFKYQAKAPTKERPKVDGVAHPTVKPLELMRWLVRLVTPPGGTVLEPFAGSGTTAEACVLEGVRCIAVEREADYLPLIVARLTKHTQTALDFGGAA